MNPAVLGAPDDLVIFGDQRGVQHDGEPAALDEVKEEEGSSSPATQAGDDDVCVEDDFHELRMTEARRASGAASRPFSGA